MTSYIKHLSLVEHWRPKNISIKLDLNRYGSIFLPVCIASLIIGAGVLMYIRVSDSTTDTDNNTNTSQTNPGTNTTQEIPDNFVEYTNEDLGISFSYPGEWGELAEQTYSGDESIEEIDSKAPENQAIAATNDYFGVKSFPRVYIQRADESAVLMYEAGDDGTFSLLYPAISCIRTSCSAHKLDSSSNAVVYPGSIGTVLIYDSEQPPFAPEPRKHFVEVVINLDSTDENRPGLVFTFIADTVEERNSLREEIVPKVLDSLRRVGA